MMGALCKRAVFFGQLVIGCQLSVKRTPVNRQLMTDDQLLFANRDSLHFVPLLAVRALRF